MFWQFHQFHNLRFIINNVTVLNNYIVTKNKVCVVITHSSFLFSGCPGSGAGSGSTSPGSSGSGSTCPSLVYKSIEVDIVLMTSQNYLWIYNTYGYRQYKLILDSTLLELPNLLVIMKKCFSRSFGLFISLI